MHNGAPVHFMNRQQIQEIILRVLAECGEQGKEQELPLDFPVEVSAKHVHLTREAVEQLFGTGAKLTPKRPLSQPGQFLSEERVTLVTSKGRIENVAVLGPERAAVQTELSLTDCRTLGIDAPLRMSGDLTGAGDVYIIGSMGMIHAKGSVIIAQAHIHITPPQAEQAGITDGQRVSVTVGAERRTTLENVMAVAKGKLTVIAHVACNNTKDSVELAKHAESLGVDAIAAIPPIYFRLPEYAIAAYWNTMSEAAPNTDFIIYNIPQLAGVALTQGLFAQMRQNPRVIGVKNSSMPVQDIQMFKAAAGKDYIIFNGPDEQFISGRVIGAEAGIGGTYGVMPELFLKMDELVKAGKLEEAKEVQYAANEVIYKMCSCHGNMYGVIKEMLRINENLDLGGVREPLPQLVEEDLPIAREAARMVREAVGKYC